MKVTLIIILTMGLMGCANHPPKPPLPSDRSPWVSINRYLPEK